MVTDLKVSGVGSRTTLVAGLVDWVAIRDPMPADVEGNPIFAQGLTGIEAITKSGGSILGRVELPPDLSISPSYRDHRVGPVHTVWGWKALARRLEDHHTAR